MANGTLAGFPAMFLAKCRRRFWCFDCESGNSAVEYGLFLSLIAIALIAGATALGSGIGTHLFQSIADFFTSRG